MYRWLALILVTALLAGCGSNANSSNQTATPMTQPIAKEESLLPQTTKSNIASNNTNPTSSQEDLLEQYYRVKAEKEIMELDLDILKADYRIGKIDQESFQKQKLQGEQKEDELEAKEDQLKLTIRQQGIALAPVLDMENTIEGLLEQKRTLETQEDKLDLEEEQEQAKYRNQTIDRNTLLTKQIEIEKKKKELDYQEDLLEERLKQLGWKD